MGPILLYHGSGNKLVGDKLSPKKANDLDKDNVNNSLTGVYASSVKDQAIAMALHSCKGVGRGSVGMGKVNGIIKMTSSIIYDGWPEQDMIYLYEFSSKNFENKPKGSSQWVSFNSVKPDKIYKLLVKDYIHLVRPPTPKESKDWIDKYGSKK